MNLFCVTNHTPLQLRDWLQKHGEIDSPNDVNIHPVGIPLDKKPKKKFLLILNLQDMLRGMEKLNSKEYKNTIVFLFCAPFRAIELDNAVMLDSAVSEDRFKFELGKLRFKSYKDALKKPITTARNPDKYLYTIVEDVKEGSFLTPLMTFIYTLPRSTLQTPVKEAVVLHVWHGKTLDKALAERQIELSAKQKSNLVEILESKGSQYIEALKFFKAKRKEDKKYPLKSLEKLYKVQAYELAYLRKIKDGLKTYGKNAGKTTLDLSGKGAK